MSLLQEQMKISGEIWYFIAQGFYRDNLQTDVKIDDVVDITMKYLNVSELLHGRPFIYVTSGLSQVFELDTVKIRAKSSINNPWSLPAGKESDKISTGRDAIMISINKFKCLYEIFKDRKSIESPNDSNDQLENESIDDLNFNILEYNYFTSQITGYKNIVIKDIIGIRNDKTMFIVLPDNISFISRILKLSTMKNKMYNIKIIFKLCKVLGHYGQKYRPELNALIGFMSTSTIYRKKWYEKNNNLSYKEFIFELIANWCIKSKGNETADNLSLFEIRTILTDKIMNDNNNIHNKNTNQIENVELNIYIDRDMYGNFRLFIVPNNKTSLWYYGNDSNKDINDNKYQGWKGFYCAYFNEFLATNLSYNIGDNNINNDLCNLLDEYEFTNAIISITYGTGKFNNPLNCYNVTYNTAFVPKINFKDSVHPKHYKIRRW